MSEQGSVQKPTIFALIIIFIVWLVSMIFLIDHPIIFVAIAAPIEWIIIAMIFSNPPRVIFAKIMHWTRFATISSAPSKKDVLWIEANQKLFDKTGVRVFEGVGSKPEASNEDE